MLTIQSGSFGIDNEEIYKILERYLNLPSFSYWQTISGHELHQENGWIIKSDMNIHLERVDQIAGNGVEIIMIWADFNAKKIAEIEAIFSKDIYLSMHSDIMDELCDETNDIDDWEMEREMSTYDPMAVS